MPFPTRLAGFLIAAAALAGPGAGAAAAQEKDLRNVTLLGIQSATVAPHGLGFASVSGTTDREGPATDIDGSIALGFGVGDASDTVGLQFTGYVTSLTNNFGDSGYFEIKAARQLTGLPTPVFGALTVSRLGAYGDSEPLDESVSAIVTGFSEIPLGASGTYPVMFTLGAGSHVRNFNTDPGVFAGAGIGLTRNVGASLAWSGEYWTLGAAFRIDQAPNFGLSTTLYDAFDQKDRQRVAFSLTYFADNLFGR